MFCFTQPPQAPQFFRVTAPAAARRAHPVQRSSFQGLRGNRDACRPGRGVVGPSYGSFASGQARKLIPSAGPPLPTEPASLGFGGGPNYCKRQWGGRRCAVGLCPVRTAHRRHEPRVQGRSPGGFPTAFDIKSGAPAESEAPGALPIKIQRSHLQKSGAPRGHPGRRTARRGRRAPRVGGYAGKRATTGRPYRRSKPCPGKSRADTIRPYRLGSWQTVGGPSLPIPGRGHIWSVSNRMVTGPSF